MARVRFVGGLSDPGVDLAGVGPVGFDGDAGEAVVCDEALGDGAAGAVEF